MNNFVTFSNKKRICKAVLFFVLVFLVSGLTFAQPVIQNGNNIAQPGYTAPVSLGNATNGPGSPGANQVWDFTGVSLTQAGTQIVVEPDSTPYFSTYSSANFCFAFEISGMPTQYFYLENSSNSLQILASNISSGGGTDYTPDPEKNLQYPFQFNDSYFDTYQKVGNDPDSVTVTYDAYGTLEMPYQTYSNVVRIRMQYNDGSDYVWYTLNPLIPILIYNYDSNSFTAFGAPPTDVKNEVVSVNNFKLEQNYPNPFNPSTKIKYSISKKEFVSLKVYDLLGREVASLVNQEQNAGNFTVNFNASNLTSGVYLYTLKAGSNVESHKMILIK